MILAMRLDLLERACRAASREDRLRPRHARHRRRTSARKAVQDEIARQAEGDARAAREQARVGARVCDGEQVAFAHRVDDRQAFCPRAARRERIANRDAALGDDGMGHESHGLLRLQAQPAAQIVNISSLFGLIAPPGQTAYCAAKFAVRGFSESLRHELEMADSPVRVTVVHPGGVRTNIAEASRKPRGTTEAQIAEQRRLWEKMLVLAPEQAAARILRGIERREPRVLVGDDAVQAAFLQRLFPVGYWKWIARGIARRAA